MAVTSEPKTRKVVAQLNNGSTATGGVKTLNVSIGSLNTERYDANQGDTKAVAIVNALIPCLDRSLYAIIRTNTDELYEE